MLKFFIFISKYMGGAGKIHEFLPSSEFLAINYGYLILLYILEQV